ncbi:hypothetical protein [Streptomyces sp. NPDC014793]|uniref:hypothetical protein n=1 Tax=Streptomyces sp. NPDC014793 TaxID=3364914 RepID=UPI0036FCA6C8
MIKMQVGLEGVAVEQTPDSWRNEYETRPECKAILARMETPWWKRPLALWGGVVGVAVASFFLGGTVRGSDGGSQTSSPGPWIQGQLEDQSQNNQPAGVTAAQKFQILNKFCTQQAGGPYDVSESALMECKNTYYVTDQGQVLPK